jgi:hypothetical protein
VICLFIFSASQLFPADFTIATYNVGGLTNHYDYLRAAAMQKVMQERYNLEPEQMAIIDRIQNLALKINFSKDPEEKSLAQQEWNKKNYQALLEKLTASPLEEESVNTAWFNKVNESITSYQIRPIEIFDQEVNQFLNQHFREITHKEGENSELVEETRALMAKKIFQYHLKYDIICLQEADYLSPDLFPEHYELHLSNSSHSLNGIAWNKNRFEFIDSIGDILSRAYSVKLLDKETGKTILIASGHISGCNPFKQEINTEGVIDSAKGDSELQTIVDLFNQQEADLKLIGMDSNVTSLHPRLNILKANEYLIDYENHIEATCASPYQVLNTRIDWIAVQDNQNRTTIKNIPVLNVHLNSIQTNISDHKAIASKITY